MQRYKGEVTYVNGKNCCGWITGDDSKSYGFNKYNINPDLLDYLIEQKPSRTNGVPVTFFPKEYTNYKGEKKNIADGIRAVDLTIIPSEQMDDEPPEAKDNPSDEEMRFEQDTRKLSLNLKQQVLHMKSQGITFELINENDAVEYLRVKNNYFRVRAFRSGFNKKNMHDGVFQFDNLDFGMLVDLAESDALLRSTMLRIVLDIERMEKLLLLETFTLDGEDAYAIPKAFLKEEASNPHGMKMDLLEERALKNDYSRGLVQKYSSSGYPLWAFLELITFGNLVHLCQFCADNFGYSEPLADRRMLMFIKHLRNACAHNNCILNELAPSPNTYKSPPAVNTMLSHINAVGNDQRRRKMDNSRIQQIVTTLYVHSALAENELLNVRREELRLFFAKALNHSNYYKDNNNTLFSSLVFLQSVFEHLYENDK